MSEKILQNNLLMNIYLNYTSIILILRETRKGLSTLCRRYCFKRFFLRIEWHKGKVMKLIREIDNKVRDVEILVYNKNSEKTSKIKRFLQSIIPIETDLLGNTEQGRSPCIESINEYNRARREIAKNDDMKRKLNDIYI